MLQQCFVLMLVLLTTSAAADGEVAEGESIHVNTISKSESCRHKVANDDRLYLWYSGIEHDTAELFDSNRGLGDSAFIMRVGEPNVLKGFQESLLGACEGDKLFIEIPASRNNDTLDSNRVSNAPIGVPIDFEVEIQLIVPSAAISATDSLLLKMRKETDVSRKDVEEALDLGMPVNIVDTNGRTLLVTAAFTANLEAARTLLKHGADPNIVMHTGMSALIYASGEGHVDILSLLLRNGAKTDAKLHLNGSPLKGYTALHFACLQGRTESVKLLLEHGANPSAKDAKGLSPLAVARSILIDGASHKGLKPRDRERGKNAFKDIKNLMINALVKEQQEQMDAEKGSSGEKAEL